MSHKRTHNLLLISKLLSQREHISPFTLVLDRLEQTAKPLLREYIRRARLGRTQTVMLAFETFTKPEGVDGFVKCAGLAVGEIVKAVEKALEELSALGKKCLIIIDSLTMLASMSTRKDSDLNLVAFLSSLLRPLLSSKTMEVSLVAVYHTDVPIDTTSSQYSPTPISLLSYMATTVITVHSLAIILAEKAARERSKPTPLFGLAEEIEGLVIGLKQQQFKALEQGLVLELEHRRKSGRGVLEWYFLPTNGSIKSQTAQTFQETTILLDDHPLFRPLKDDGDIGLNADNDLSGLTFELGLTERQRLERDGVVLPYFDAQKGGGIGGPGEGGRILYDMGVEDDFDEDEDEI